MGLNQMERIHKIDQLLSGGRCMSRHALLAELAVSAATFKRDLEFMKDRLNAPLIWDSALRGYRFAESLQAGPRYTLPGLWFNESELYALLTMQHLLDKVEPGLLAPHLRPLHSKIQAVLCTGNKEPQEVARRVRIFSHGRRRMDLKYFQAVASATMERKRIEILHFNRDTNIRSERVISPQQLAYYRDNWYVDCWCHLREAVRSFSLDSIESVVLLLDTAVDVQPETLQKALGQGYGIFGGEHVQWAQLRIAPKRARWASRMTWHPEEKSAFDDNGFYCISVPYTDDRELLNDILSLLPDIDVLGPAPLQQRLRNVLDQALTNLARIAQ
jgi:predicted DNA-binding transcriptional regulator YafY